MPTDLQQALLCLLFTGTELPRLICCRAWAHSEGLLPGSPDAPAAGAGGVRFVFDGDALQPEDTPERMEMEGGEIVEVHL